MNRNEIEERIVRAKRELKSAEHDLVLADKNCNHQWGETTPDHIRHNSYTIPGDEPGTMGVDFRGPCHIVARTEKRWRRECKKCGKVEFTTNIKTEQVERPRW